MTIAITNDVFRHMNKCNIFFVLHKMVQRTAITVREVTQRHVQLSLACNDRIVVTNKCNHISLTTC